jgi:hypothetical protein
VFGVVALVVALVHVRPRLSHDLVAAVAVLVDMLKPFSLFHF